MTSSRVALAVLGIFVLLGAADASAARQRDRHAGHHARPRTATYVVPARPARVMRTAQAGRYMRAPEVARNVRLDTRALQASRPLPNPARASRMAQAPRRNLLFRGS